MCMCVCDLLQELAHAITKAKKSHNMLSGSWGARTVGGITQLESKDPRIGGASQ